MIKITKYSIAKIIPIVLIFVVFYLCYFILEKKSFTAPIAKYDENFDELLFDFVSQLRARWELGDVEGRIGEGRFSCTNISHKMTLKHFPFFQCNSAYMTCFLSGGLLDVSIPSAFTRVGAKWLPNQTWHDQNGNVIYRFTTNLSSKVLSVKLENYCHQTYLPQKIYSTGLRQDLEYAWDNYNQDIFIDKYYVNRYQVRKWIKKNKQDMILEGDHLPALNLTLSQMKEFCHNHGKALLQSHIFDASSFFPSVFKNGYIFKSKYPWGSSKKDPAKIQNLSWNGVEYVLGGEMEVFDNLFTEKRNLKVSSQYLKSDNFWHRNGLRAFWQGESLLQDQFDFLEIYSGKRYEVQNKNGVAFRCMLIK